MKEKLLLFAGLFICSLGFAQPMSSVSANAPKIKLTKGQKIAVESTSTMEASMAMGMELSSNSTSVNSLEVKQVTDKDYTVSSTLTRMKLSMNMMGQSNVYDSENKGSNSPELAGVLDDKMNKPVDILIDQNGNAIPQKKKTNSDEETMNNPGANMMKMFVDNSDEALVSGAFEFIPAGKAIGDSWADTAVDNESKTIRKYTLKSISGNTATLGLEVSSKGSNKIDFQGMEFEVKTENNGKGEITTDTVSGMVSKRVTNSEITGSVQMMGQDMPISAKVNSTIVYNQ